MNGANGFLFLASLGCVIRAWEFSAGLQQEYRDLLEEMFLCVDAPFGSPLYSENIVITECRPRLYRPQMKNKHVSDVKYIPRYLHLYRAIHP
jgi:hypothetical protein